MEIVYDNGGECLGDEWIDLSELQNDTKKAILQMIYLDNTLDALNTQVNKCESNTLKIVDSCFHTYASSFRGEAKDMAKDLLNNV